ncbi:MAG: hypothetical protein NVS4B2_31390 [Chloroflexota bacterium]
MEGRDEALDHLRELGHSLLRQCCKGVADLVFEGNLFSSHAAYPDYDRLYEGTRFVK